MLGWGEPLCHTRSSFLCYNPSLARLFSVTRILYLAQTFLAAIAGTSEITSLYRYLMGVWLLRGQVSGFKPSTNALLASCIQQSQLGLFAAWLYSAFALPNVRLRSMLCVTCLQYCRCSTQSVWTLFVLKFTLQMEPSLPASWSSACGFWRQPRGISQAAGLTSWEGMLQQHSQLLHGTADCMWARAWWRRMHATGTFGSL